MRAGFTKHIEGVECPQESQHTASPEGYLQWHYWAEKKTKTHKQVKCSACGRYAIWIPKSQSKEGESPVVYIKESE